MMKFNITQPNKMPAMVRMMTLKPSTTFQESTPFFSDKKMAIKSVPPVGKPNK